MNKQGIMGLSVRMSTAAMALTGIGLVLPRLAGELNFTPAQQGGLVSVQYIGFTAAVLVGGALSDRFGQTRMMRLALLGAAVALALLGSVWSYWAAIAALLLIGASGSILENAITALAMADERRKDHNNIVVQIAFSAGAVVLPLLLLVSLLFWNQWRPPYWVAAALALALFALTPRGGASAESSVPFSRILKQFAGFFKKPSCLIAPAAVFLYVGAETGLWAFAPVYLEGSGFGMYSGIVSSALIWFMMMLGRMVTTRVVVKLGIIGTMLCFGALAMLAFVLLMSSSGVWAVVWTGVIGFAYAPFFSLIISWMSRITGEASSTTIAFTMACGTLGPVAMGVLTGLVGEAYGMRSIMLLPLGFIILLYAILIVFRKQGNG